MYRCCSSDFHLPFNIVFTSSIILIDYFSGCDKVLFLKEGIIIVAIKVIISMVVVVNPCSFFFINLVAFCVCQFILILILVCDIQTHVYYEYNLYTCTTSLLLKKED